MIITNIFTFFVNLKKNDQKEVEKRYNYYVFIIC